MIFLGVWSSGLIMKHTPFYNFIGYLKRKEKPFCQTFFCKNWTFNRKKNVLIKNEILKISTIYVVYYCLENIGFIKLG